MALVGRYLGSALRIANQTHENIYRLPALVVAAVELLLTLSE